MRARKRYPGLCRLRKHPVICRGADAGQMKGTPFRGHARGPLVPCAGRFLSPGVWRGSARPALGRPSSDRVGRPRESGRGGRRVAGVVGPDSTGPRFISIQFHSIHFNVLKMIFIIQVKCVKMLSMNRSGLRNNHNKGEPVNKYQYQ